MHLALGAYADVLQCNVALFLLSCQRVVSAFTRYSLVNINCIIANMLPCIQQCAEAISLYHEMTYEVIQLGRPADINYIR
jgi:hypothetical protein